MLYRDSSNDLIARIKNIEERADRCLEHFALLATPPHLASWTILSATIYILEDNLRRFGPDSSKARAAILNLSRHAPMLIRWLGRGGTTATLSGWLPQWDSIVGQLAMEDLRVVANYDAFRNSYPMWHRNRLTAELLNTDVVLFRTLTDSRDRQVSAFQKGLRRSGDEEKVGVNPRIVPTSAILRRYQRIIDSARPVGTHGFSYEHPDELASRTFRMHIQRMGKISRRSESIDLGPYSLGTFKRVYAALQSVCAIHDFMCFCWERQKGIYPIESAVLVKTRKEWIRLMAFHSGSDVATTEQVLNDLTFHSKRLPDLHVFPFVPLDEGRETLALVPQFILSSSPEDNILRTCSYLRENAYSRLSDDKAGSMLEDIMKSLGRFHCAHSIRLPNGSTDVDLVVEDQDSSTVVIAELKWYRKPSTYRERLRADADFEDGYRRQLAMVQEYCRQYPEWLQKRGTLKYSLSTYRNVFYLLIGRDHWNWIEPRGPAAVVECEQFRSSAERHKKLNEAVREVLNYEWLPIEGEDFHVQYDRGIVEGVAVESEVYYGGPPLSLDRSTVTARVETAGPR